MKIFNKMKEEKGFTLIELAIVLVIIGIIIGAVLKGQDLIESARIKRFDNSVREWETAVWTYVDRKGQFPGDSAADGIIGNNESGAGSSAGGDITEAKFINAPDDNPMTIGSLQFWVYFGNDGDTPAKNLLVICAAVDCNTAFTDDDEAGNLKYIESFDTIIDGLANGAEGNVVGDDDLPTLQPTDASEPNEMIVKGVTTGEAYGSGTTLALIYYFDRGN